jgi:hypothetical protein
LEKGWFHVRNPDVCAAIAFYGIDSLLKRGGADDPGLIGGIREMTAKTLGLKDTALAITNY